MESKWVINFEDIVYLIISAALVCLITTWMFSVLLISKKSNNYKWLNTSLNNSISKSLPKKGIESNTPPIVSQQLTHQLNIHPLKVFRIQRKADTLPPSSQNSCTNGDCK